MISPEILFDGPESAPLTVALAHGAGAPMDSPFLAFFATALADEGYRVARFEFPYMAERRRGGNKRPPDRQSVLENTWDDFIALLGATGLVIGGKSMGGRLASLVADRSAVRGLVCLGYPFHPPGRADKQRGQHLMDLKTPCLIVQGSRDPFGTKEEVKGYRLSSKIGLHWAEDGNHDLAPRKASGRTTEQNWREAVEAITIFLRTL